MRTGKLASVYEYLSTSYRPDRDCARELRTEKPAISVPVDELFR
jgi:hypothetical protein